MGATATIVNKGFIMIRPKMICGLSLTAMMLQTKIFEIGQTVSEIYMLKSVDAKTSWTPDQFYAIISLCEQKTCCQKNCGQLKGNNAYSDSTKLGAYYIGYHRKSDWVGI